MNSGNSLELGPLVVDLPDGDLDVDGLDDVGHFVRLPPGPSLGSRPTRPRRETTRTFQVDNGVADPANGPGGLVLTRLDWRKYG